MIIIIIIISAESLFFPFPCRSIMHATKESKICVPFLLFCFFFFVWKETYCFFRFMKFWNEIGRKNKNFIFFLFHFFFFLFLLLLFILFFFGCFDSLLYLPQKQIEIIIMMQYYMHIHNLSIHEIWMSFVDSQKFWINTHAIFIL